MNTTEINLDALDLIARVSHVMDGRDPEAFVHLFTDDGVLKQRSKQGDTFQWQGREELTAYISNLYKERGGDQPRHHVRNTVFLEVTENRVVTSTYFLLTNVSGKGGFASVTATGIFQDEMVFTAKGLKIKERAAVFD